MVEIISTIVALSCVWALLFTLRRVSARPVRLSLLWSPLFCCVLIITLCAWLCWSLSLDYEKCGFAGCFNGFILLTLLLAGSNIWLPSAGLTLIAAATRLDSLRMWTAVAFGSVAGTVLLGAIQAERFSFASNPSVCAIGL
jgi:hypothetical protein